MPATIETEIIDTAEKIADLVDWLTLRHESPLLPSLTMYIDLEGVRLCREGSLSIFTLLVDTGISTRRIYLLDVHTLGAKVFDTAGTKVKTLRDILQDEKIPKVFFDVRNDSDALFAHFGVALQGVEDVQLMESATRKTTPSRRFLGGLAKCIEQNLLTGTTEIARWRLTKEKGEKLFNPERGGSYQIFNQRPMLENIVAYCVGDVKYLPALRDIFWKSRSLQFRELVVEESRKRVADSQKPEYKPRGQHRALAPWSKEQNVTLDQWHRIPS